MGGITECDSEAGDRGQYDGDPYQDLFFIHFHGKIPGEVASGVDSLVGCGLHLGNY